MLLKLDYLKLPLIYLKMMHFLKMIDDDDDG